MLVIAWLQNHQHEHTTTAAFGFMRIENFWNCNNFWRIETDYRYACFSL